MKDIIMADSYPLILETAIAHLSKLPDINLLATCQTERELKAALERRQPDILILDLNMLSGDPLKYCRQLTSRSPMMKILLFGKITDIQLLRKFFQIGVYGYLPRTARAQQLIKAVETLADGKIFVPDFFRNQLAEISLGIQANGSGQLTNREKEVLKLIIDEYTTKEIAKKLYISSSTAETHRLNIIHKLGVRNTAGLVREGLMKGLYV